MAPIVGKATTCVSSARSVCLSHRGIRRSDATARAQVFFIDSGVTQVVRVGSEKLSDEVPALVDDRGRRMTQWLA